MDREINIDLFYNKRSRNWGKISVTKQQEKRKEKKKEKNPVLPLKTPTQ